jgi:alpha-tubulin suppressor-like RCC1 family protein
MFSWGFNDAGQLGLNVATNRSSPTQIGALTSWSSIATGHYHALAIKPDGTLWAWGYNNQGQLGLNNTTYAISSPVQVGALTTWSKIAGGTAFTLAIKTDGTLWSWGQNNQGQLGKGDAIDKSSPVQVGALTTWASVDGGGNFSLAVKTDGTLWSWGRNNGKQLGLGNTTDYSSPKQVGALTNWLKVAGGLYNHALAIKTDGTLWSWGQNNYGRLGLDDAVAKSSPVQVGALTSWLNIAAGYYMSSAIQTNGTLWTWGSGLSGQLGHENTDIFSSPKQVGSFTDWSILSNGKEFMVAG